ncbi:hypothetical protein [Azohydromonas australica]|uniref:hypothetical protein n=1 Tax=Azohydromonas australica TaxID=364039 RepID=UPI00049200BF|nr:hypothetical protein [Azohydromonas australica]
MNCSPKASPSAVGREGRDGVGGVQSMVAAVTVLLMLLTGCDGPAERQVQLSGDVRSASAPAARVVEAMLRRFECSDEKCWLEVELPDRRVVSGVCEAPICVQWLDNGARLPSDLVGCRARIELRQTPIFIGTEEDRMVAEEFRRITLLE